MNNWFQNVGRPLTTAQLLNRLEDIMVQAERRRLLRDILDSLRALAAHLTLEGD